MRCNFFRTVKVISRFRHRGEQVSLPDMLSWGMSLLRERSRRSVWERDWKKDHRLAQASFGFLLVVLAAWLVVLYSGRPACFLRDGREFGQRRSPLNESPSGLSLLWARGRSFLQPPPYSPSLSGFSEMANTISWVLEVVRDP